MADAPEILKDEKLRDSYPKLNAAIRNSNEALSTANTAKTNADNAVTTANAANAKSDDTQQQLNNIVINNGQSDAEVLQARGTYAVLNDRLNDTDAQLADVAKLSIEKDIDSTSLKKGQKVDPNYLKSIQAQKFASFMRKLRTNLPVTINCQGDSLTYGADNYSADRRGPDPIPAPDGASHTSDRASKTYPEALGEFLNQVYGGTVSVINRGFGGIYASASYTRYYTKHSADLTLLMLGTNDSRNTNTPYVGDVETYLYWMEQLIIRELLWGKAVVLLTSPKVRTATDLNVDTFANSLYLLGHKYGIPVIDTQPFVENYPNTIYSDVTHFTGEGYTIFGSRVASVFVGEGAVHVNRVSSGSNLLTRTMNDNIHYINGCDFTWSTGNSTPDEFSAGNSIVLKLTNGKAIYSFYSETENLLVLPTLFGYVNSSFKMTLDFNVKQPENALDTAVFMYKNMPDNIPNKMTLNTADVAMNYYKDYFLRNNIEPLRVANKGWHTLLIESTGDTTFLGLEFMSFQEWDNLKRAVKVSSNDGIFSKNSSTAVTLDFIKGYTKNGKGIFNATISHSSGFTNGYILGNLNAEFPPISDMKIPCACEDVNGNIVSGYLSVGADRFVRVYFSGSNLRKVYMNVEYLLAS